jgi:hypothetical protein
MRNLIPYSRRTGKIVGLSLVLSLSVGMFAGSSAALAVNPQDSVRGFYDTLLTTMKIATGTALTLLGGLGGVIEPVFSPDGHALLKVSSDGVVRIYPLR